MKTLASICRKIAGKETDAVPISCTLGRIFAEHANI